jgi:hypothetical protein
MTPETLAAVREKAAEFNVPAGNLAAMVEVESAGLVFATVNGEPRPLILFEPHVFYRRLKGEERDRAVAAGLAYPSQGKKPYPKTQDERWGQVETAALISSEEAYQSTSYGVGQVMGYHWKALGYESLQAFLDTMFSGVGGQIDAMLRYCHANHLMDELRDGRWLALARGYNGPKFAKSYGAKLERKARQFGGSAAGTDGMLRLGSKGARVRELQALLNRAGARVKVDGDFGPATRDALKVFQLKAGLRADGVYGPKTEAALAEYRQGQADKPGKPNVTDIDEVKQGGAGVGGGIAIETIQNKVDEATTNLQGLSGFEPWLSWGLALLSVIALGLALWGAWRAISGWLKAQKTVEA